MQKITVTKIATKDIEIEGRTVKKVSILTQEYGDEWLSAFYNKFNEKQLSSLQEGDTLKVITWKKGEYLNFKLPTKTDLLEERLEVVEKKLGLTPDSQ